jgi:2-oxoglutarate/2-oxoacid ferredoxin oxidoreductase subunit beta
VLYDIVSAAFHHKGFSFVRIIQRCPEWLPKLHEPWMQDPDRILLLQQDRGLRAGAATSAVFRHQLAHDPGDLAGARELASSVDPIPVGILYRNPDVPCYEDLRRSPILRTPDLIRAGLEAELDKVTVWPDTDRKLV